MNLRSMKLGARIRSTLALLAVASTAALLSTAAQAQHMHGSGGGHWSGHAAGTAPHMSGQRGGFRHHRNFNRFVVIGGAGFLYPYAFPYYGYGYGYGYDPALMPGYAVSPSAPTYYYCDAAGAYYPQVTTCEGGWRAVPVTPQPLAPPQQ